MFDGVHIGHKAVLQQLRQLAQQSNAGTAILTFSPHPRQVLQKDVGIKLLTLQSEKFPKLCTLDIDYIYEQRFDLPFSRLTAEDFVHEICLQQIGMTTLVIGHDHQFGKNREGDFAHLQELSEKYGFRLVRAHAIELDGKPVSSTKIRNALQQGNLDYAHRALGYNYHFSGRVIHGDKIGRKLNFPTINLQVHPNKLLPKNGVYGVQASIAGRQYYGVMNMGSRPSLSQEEYRIEVYVFDFEEDVYDQEVQITLMARLRDEQKFADLTALQSQIAKDVSQFRQMIS